MEKKCYYSWRTKKTKVGYEFTVAMIYGRSEAEGKNEYGNYADTEILKKGIMPTRARAKTRAIKYIRYYRAVA